MTPRPRISIDDIQGLSPQEARALLTEIADVMPLLTAKALPAAPIPNKAPEILPEHERVGCLYCSRPMTVKELAKWLRMAPKTIYERTKKGGGLTRLDGVIHPFDSNGVRIVWPVLLQRMLDGKLSQGVAGND